MNETSADILYDLGFMDGLQAEHERIIKLLEADKKSREPHCSMEACKECPVYEDGFDDAIALIKGENR